MNVEGGTGRGDREEGGGGEGGVRGCRRREQEE